MQTKFNNNYIVIDEFSNPEIKIVINDKYEVPFKIRARWFCEKHSKKIVFIVLCIIIGIIAAIILGDNKGSQYSCMGYTQTSLASEISIKCFQQIWSNCGCANKGFSNFPDNYKGWWNNSRYIKVDISLYSLLYQLLFFLQNK